MDHLKGDFVRSGSALDETGASKTILRAEELAFRIRDNFNFSGIEHIGPDESKVYESVYSYAQAAQKIFKSAETKEYSGDLFCQFQPQIYGLIEDLKTATSEAIDAVSAKSKALFRSEIFHYLSQSDVAIRALTKPFGYPGDFRMLQMLYDDLEPSSTTIGKLLDRFFMEDPLAKAVVGRANFMSKYLLTFIEKFPRSTVHILNIASGSGFDLLPIAKTRHDKEVVIHCFDQEPASLAYTKHQLERVNINTRFVFYREDIKTFFRQIPASQKFDLIYNIGLADYLSDRILIALVENSLRQLDSNGRLLVAHKDFDYVSPTGADWLYDWKFIYRPIKETECLIANEWSKNEYQFEFIYPEKDNIIYFLTMVKNE
ncbi:class I SAM-dependent methyltransferase [bacterium]|nr:class I SAM-dependent methyltransferase [bacterium]